MIVSSQGDQKAGFLSARGGTHAGSLMSGAQPFLVTENERSSRPTGY
jgi:hypothetical protein